MRILSEDEYFEILLERAGAIYNAVALERARCARLCAKYAGVEGVADPQTSPRQALLNMSAMILAADPSPDRPSLAHTEDENVERAVRELGDLAIEGKVPGTGYLYRADLVRAVVVRAIKTAIAKNGGDDNGSDTKTRDR